LTSKALKACNRGYQTFDMVSKTVFWARKAGFKYIEIDTLLGLYGETPESFARSFSAIAGLKPSTISVFPCQPTQYYVKKCFENDYSRFNAHGKDVMKCIPSLLKIAQKFDYKILEKSVLSDKVRGPIFFVHKNTPKTKSVEILSGVDNRDESFLSIGDFSNSRITGMLGYYTSKLNIDPSKTKHEVCRIEGTQQMLLYILKNLSDCNYIARSDFKDTFGQDIQKIFNDGIKKLLKLKKISLNKKNLIFIPKEPKEQFACVLFLFPIKKLYKH